MKPAYKTESNAVYAALTVIAREGRPEPSESAFKQEWRIHQNRRGFILTRRTTK